MIFGMQRRFLILALPLYLILGGCLGRIRWDSQDVASIDIWLVPDPPGEIFINDMSAIPDQARPAVKDMLDQIIESVMSSVSVVCTIQPVSDPSTVPVTLRPPMKKTRSLMRSANSVSQNPNVIPRGVTSPTGIPCCVST